MIFCKSHLLVNHCYIFGIVRKLWKCRRIVFISCWYLENSDLPNNDSGQWISSLNLREISGTYQLLSSKSTKCDRETIWNVIILMFVRKIVNKNYHSAITETLLKPIFPITEKRVKLLKTIPLITDSGCSRLASL